MLNEIGRWYFDYGWIISTVISLPLGVFASKKGGNAILWVLGWLFIIGTVMLIFKNV